MIGKICLLSLHHAYWMGAIKKLTYSWMLLNERASLAGGIDVTLLFGQHLCDIWLEITEIVSTGLIKSNTHQYAARFKTVN